MPVKIADIQSALILHGFPVGLSGADGVWARDSIAGMKAFQAAKGLPTTGSYDAATLSALDLAEKSAPEPPWLVLARRKLGLQEVRDNKKVREFLASDKHALGDPAKLPWCGDFIETCIALTLPKERMVVNPYWAANWGKFGVPLAEPAPGAILVLTRQGGGHVCFYVGEEKANHFVLGGNQSNSVSIMKIAKTRVGPGGIRWPASVPLPSTGRNVTSLKVALSTNEA